MQDPREQIDDVVLTAEDGTQWVPRWRRIEIEAERDGGLSVIGEAELLPVSGERSPGHMQTLPLSRRYRVQMPLERVPQALADALAVYLYDEADAQGPALLERIYNPTPKPDAGPDPVVTAPETKEL